MILVYRGFYVFFRYRFKVIRVRMVFGFYGGF